MTTPDTEQKPTRKRPVRRSDLTKLVDENKSLVITNQKRNIVVFSMKVNGATEECEWQAQGDRNGEDTMEVPSTYLLNAKFREALNKGILKITDADDPEVLEAFEAQQAAYNERERAKTESDRLIESQQVRAFSGKPCIAGEGNRPCGEYAIYSQNSDERPPLCQTHAHLASQFVPHTEDRLGADGKPVTTWHRAQIG